MIKWRLCNIRKYLGLTTLGCLSALRFDNKLNVETTQTCIFFLGGDEMLRIVAVSLVSAVALSASAYADGLKDGPPNPGWAGGYAGVYGGYTFGNSKVTSTTTSAPLWPAAPGNYTNGRPVVTATTASPNPSPPTYLQAYQTLTYTPGQAAIDQTQSPILAPEGLDVGGTAGYNWQRGRLVFGVEGSAGAFHPSDTANTTTPTVSFSPYPALAGTLQPGNTIPVVLNQNAVTSVTTVDADWLATIRGRLGYATDRTLFYGTGGAAFTSIDFHQRNVYSNGGTYLVQTGTGAVTNTGIYTNPATENTSATSTRVGWVAGGGVEMKIGGNWSGKLEYLHLDFGDFSTHGIAPVTGGAAVTVNHSVDFKSEVVQAGLNYHFRPAYEPLK